MEFLASLYVYFVILARFSRLNWTPTYMTPFLNVNPKYGKIMQSDVCMVII